MSFNFECPICLMNGDPRGGSEGVVALTICGHVFHKHCIQQCKQQSDLCPICKRKATRMLCLFGHERTSQEDEVAEVKVDNDEGDNNVLLESLRDENDRLGACLAEAMDKLRHNEKGLYNKDVEVFRLASELTSLNAYIAKLHFKLSLYQDRFGTDVSLELDALMAEN